ncbi:unnamed protein product [Brassica oleracea]
MEHVLLLITILLCLAFSGRCIDAYSRNDFPEGFLFGSAFSAFQWEGAVDEDGRMPSIWDTYIRSNNAPSGDIACDGYHKYKEDVRLMYDMGLDAFRLSISWSRLIPGGRGPVNPKGLLFYKNLIDELTRHGIEPHVTLYHNDLPQALEDEYGGWIDRRIMILHPLVFGDYPDTMKRLVGKRLPSFSEEETKVVKDSSDFIGVIHYTTMTAAHVSTFQQGDFSADMNALVSPFGNSTLVKYDVLPWGLEGVLAYIKENYGNPPVYILENGQSTNHYSSLDDVERVEYLQAYIGAVLDSVRNGSKTRGYFQWSFMDLYEFLDTNYTYGLYYVNFSHPERKRSPKTSAFWYSAFLKGMIVSSQDMKNLSVSSSTGFSSQ